MDSETPIWVSAKLSARAGVGPGAGAGAGKWLSGRGTGELLLDGLKGLCALVWGSGKGRGESAAPASDLRSLVRSGEEWHASAQACSVEEAAVCSSGRQGYPSDGVLRSRAGVCVSTVDISTLSLSLGDGTGKRLHASGLRCGGSGWDMTALVHTVQGRNEL